MRNGNCIHRSQFLPTHKFLPYLWGMETYCGSNCYFWVWDSSYRTYEEWKHIDWWWWFYGDVWFLPYLWGMETVIVYHTPFLQFCSYRTYEEWKQILKIRRQNTDDGSYRTYEEWKPSTNASSIGIDAEFLPYLWGMETKKSSKSRYKNIQFLPYLWGMETCVIRFSSSCYHFVLTVPMRNGNK